MTIFGFFIGFGYDNNNNNNNDNDSDNDIDNDNDMTKIMSLTMKQIYLDIKSH